MQREQRLNRLAALRALQHDAATAQLQSANHAFVAACETYQREVQGISDARTAMETALLGSDQESWLMSHADAAWGRMSLEVCRRQRAAAHATKQKAVQLEAEARMAAKQMETAVETLRAARQEEEIRLEQKALDEMALRMGRQASRAAQGSRRIP